MKKPGTRKSLSSQVRPMLGWLLTLLVLLPLAFSSCRYKAPKPGDEDSIPQLTQDSLAYLYQYHYTLGTNLIVKADTLLLYQLPIAGKYDTLYRGDTIAVAEFMVLPSDSIDSIWVKVAHDQEVQGWVPEKSIDESFIPINAISTFITLFSSIHGTVFTALIALFALICLFRFSQKKKARLVFYHDIESAYPLLLCFLTAFCATLYESIQVFRPETWEHFYFNPTLNPFQTPFVLSLFLLGLWGIVIVLLAAIEEVFKMLRFSAALFYLSGLIAACIVCYLFFIFAARIYIGYPLLIYFFYRIVRKALGAHTYHYRCGRCGALLRKKGECPSCHAINQ